LTEKEQYRELCRRESSIPVFSRDWWLDCVCGEAKWDALLYLQGERVVAAMPYYIPCSGIITMPAFTQTMGVWFNPDAEESRTASELHRKQSVCEDIIKRLPRHRYFLQRFHYSFTDWLPFYWNGFRQTTRYTYILPDITDNGILWECVNKSIRKNVLKAKEKYELSVIRGISTDNFLNLNKQVFDRQKIKQHNPDVLQRLIGECRKRGQGEIWGAVDKHNSLLAAVFVVWQDSVAYLLASGRIAEAGHTKAETLAVWEALCDLSSQVKVFDFEGSMIRGVENFHREFGAIQKPYFQIEKGKMTLWKKLLLKINR